MKTKVKVPEHSREDLEVRAVNLLLAGRRKAASKAMVESFSTCCQGALSYADSYKLQNEFAHHIMGMAMKSDIGRRWSRRVEFWLAIGVLLIDTRDWAAATFCFERALTLKPDNVGTMELLATCLLATERSAGRAERLLRKAAEAKPKDQAVLINLGRALLLQGRASEADEAFRRAIAIDEIKAAMLVPLFYPGQTPVQYEGSAGERFVQLLTVNAANSGSNKALKRKTGQQPGSVVS